MARRANERRFIEPSSLGDPPAKDGRSGSLDGDRREDPEEQGGVMVPAEGMEQGTSERHWSSEKRTQPCVARRIEHELD